MRVQSESADSTKTRTITPDQVLSDDETTCGSASASVELILVASAQNDAAAAETFKQQNTEAAELSAESITPPTPVPADPTTTATTTTTTMAAVETSPPVTKVNSNYENNASEPTPPMLPQSPLVSVAADLPALSPIPTNESLNGTIETAQTSTPTRQAAHTPVRFVFAHSTLIFCNFSSTQRPSSLETASFSASQRSNSRSEAIDKQNWPKSSQKSSLAAPTRRNPRAQASRALRLEHERRQSTISPSIRIQAVFFLRPRDPRINLASTATQRSCRSPTRLRSLECPQTTTIVCPGRCQTTRSTACRRAPICSTKNSNCSKLYAQHIFYLFMRFFYVLGTAFINPGYHLFLALTLNQSLVV